MGSVVISIDAELGWGFHDLPDPSRARIEAGRSGWSTLLNILDTHDIPATWAVVGHLMLDDCDGIHADHSSIPGWFDRERGAWQDRPDLRFGSDLVADLIESPTDHEVACHTFSHVLFDDARVTRDIAIDEIEASIRVADSVGIEFDSFIFPRNAVSHRDLVAAYGFTGYRSLGPVPDGQLRQSAMKLLAAIDPRPVELVTPRVDEYGLVDVPPSLYLFGFEDLPRRVAERLGTDPIVRQAKRGIDRASRSDGVFHMWLHPNNLQTERDVTRLEQIIRYLAEIRVRTDLQVETIAEVSARTRNPIRALHPTIRQ